MRRGLAPSEGQGTSLSKPVLTKLSCEVQGEGYIGKVLEWNSHRFRETHGSCHWAL